MKAIANKKQKSTDMIHSKLTTGVNGITAFCLYICPCAGLAISGILGLALATPMTLEIIKW